MATRKIVTAKDARLREKSRPVEKADKKLLGLLKDLEDTLLVQDDPEGVGLAAPQIGVNLRVFVMRYRGKIVPIVNPEILSVSERTNDPEEKPSFAKASEGKQNDFVMEGCLSLPHYYGPAKRSWQVTLKYQTIRKPMIDDRKPKTDNRKLITEIRVFSGFPAQIIQHEVDHLDGKIFIDRLLEQKRKLYESKGKGWKEVELP